MAISLGILTQHFQTYPNLEKIAVDDGADDFDLGTSLLGLT